MPLEKLNSALSKIDWHANIATLVADTQPGNSLASANLRLAIWAKQFEEADRDNPALCFIREMQVAGQYVAVLIALSLYKPAAGSIRSVLETGLYYTYFRNHLVELHTQARGGSYYLEKRELMEFHKIHTPMFVELQQKLGVISRLEKWYGQISALVHGQIPGVWVDHHSVSEIKPIKATQDIAIESFVEGVEILHRMFLCSTGRELWDSFASDAKKQLLTGMHGDLKKALLLDSA